MTPVVMNKFFKWIKKTLNDEDTTDDFRHTRVMASSSNHLRLSDEDLAAQLTSHRDELRHQHHQHQQ